MSQRKVSDERILTNIESQFVSSLSQAELNYYKQLLPPSLLLNNKTSSPKRRDLKSNYEIKTNNNDETGKYKKLHTRIPGIFGCFDDNNGNGLLPMNKFDEKYKYENIIMKTENNYIINKITNINNGKVKAMKTYNMRKGEKYNSDRKEANDLLTKWIVMRNLNILNECEIYNGKYAIHCVQKLWDTDLETYIKNNINNNMFSHDKINSHIALFMKSIIPKIELMHSYGIILGDIKPSNLMMNYDSDRNTPIDFGIIDFQCISEYKEVCYKSFGTIHYRPPEMDITLHKNIIVSYEFDIYSLGISLLEIINGQHPYLNELRKTHKYFKIPNELNGFVDQNKINRIIQQTKWLQLNENEDFKDLLQQMIHTDKDFRYTIDEIVEHPWYQKYCS